MIKKICKLISLLWKCTILAVRVELLDRKVDRLARKSILPDEKWYSLQVKMMELIAEGESYCCDAEKIMGKI